MTGLPGFCTAHLRIMTSKVKADFDLKGLEMKKWNKPAAALPLKSPFREMCMTLKLNEGL